MVPRCSIAVELQRGNMLAESHFYFQKFIISVDVRLGSLADINIEAVHVNELQCSLCPNERLLYLFLIYKNRFSSCSLSFIRIIT